MVTPNTIVKLYSGIPCDPTYQNVLQWDSVTEQNQFFANKVPVATYTDFQFIDGTRELRIKRQMENCYHINYVAYQNHRYGNKWFYAFVSDMRYLSPESTALILDEDVWASWQFDLTFNKSFVERETVSNDAIGANTVPEDLELGPYVATSESNKLFTTYQMIMMATEIVDNISAQPLTPAKLGGLPNPCYVLNFGEFESVNYSAVTETIDAYAVAGKSDAIVGFFLIPQPSGSILQPNVYKETFAGAPRTLTITPRNNKLYTYPYCALSVNSLNEVKAFRYELFSESPTFQTAQTFGGNPTVSCTPLNYEGMSYNIKHQISCGGFPVLPWIRDYYQNWLAQNKAAQAVSAVSGVLSGAALGAGAGVAATGVGAVGGTALAVQGTAFSIPAAGGALLAGGAAAPMLAGAAILGGIAIGKTLAKMYAAQVVPDTLNGSANAADVNSADKKNGFYTQCMCIRAEYARIIDDYFSMYGYAVHRLKNVELHTRTNWDYIKTIGANIEGNCPASVLMVVKGIFNQGVTLWHNGTFNYGTLDNPIITTS